MSKAFKMMCSSWLLWTVVMCLVFPGSLLSLPASCTRKLNEMDPHEKVTFYMKGLVESMGEEIDVYHSVHKRSAGDQGYFGDIVSYLSNVCLIWNTTFGQDLKKESNGENYEFESEPSILSKTAEHHIVDWYTPESFPARVSAERDRDMVKVVFDVIHPSSSQAIAVTMYSLDFQENIINASLDMSASSNALTTTGVVFFADGNRCISEENEVPNEQLFYGFSERYNVNQFSIATLDLCRFDRFWNKSGNNHGAWQLKEGKKIFEEDLPMPRFRLVPDPGKFMFIKSGDNPVFETDVTFSSSEFAVHAEIWDWEESRIIREYFKLRMDEDDIKVDRRMVRSQGFGEEFLEIIVLNKTVRNNTSDDNINNADDRNKRDNDKNKIEGIGGLNNRNKEVEAKIRVTIDLKSKKRSGTIWFEYRWEVRSWYDRPIIREMTWQKGVEMRLPYKLSALPGNMLVVEGENSRCDEDGNRMFTKRGKNCTVQCLAWGTDLQSVFLLKTGPYEPPVKSSSYVLQGTIGYAQLDVGPASDDNAGTYKCVGLTKNGTIKTKDIKLYTSQFTNIRKPIVEEFDNGTTKVICPAIGLQPLNMSIYLLKDGGNKKQRVDNKTGMSRILTKSESETNLTVVFMTEELKYPTHYLMCQANGDNGNDSEFVLLREFIKNQNPLIPRMKSNDSSLTVFDNGTSQFICAASGGNKTMEIKLTYGGKADKFRIDQDPEHVRTVEDTPDGRTVTFLIPTRLIQGRSSWVSCGVENNFGWDWTDFYLNNYGIHNNG